MKISAISYQDFTGKKANKFKTAAAAAAIATSPLAVQEADAQIFSYPIVPYNVRVVPAIPNSLVVGNLKNLDFNKSMKEVFNELDINQNGVISAKEVMRTEASNWNRFNLISYNTYQAQNVYNQFNAISTLYNDDNNSDPSTINYKEYKEIMTDYIETKKVANFLGLMHLFMRPYHSPHRVPPHHAPSHPMQRHHHH